MSNKDQLFPFRLAQSQSMAADFSTAKIRFLHLDRGSISVNVLSGAPVGNFSLQGRTSFSPDPSGAAPKFVSSTGPATEWTTIPGSGQAAPAAGGSISWDISDSGYTEIRVAYAATSGAGSCDVWAAAKRSG